MRSDYRVVLDACVLAPASLGDLLLTLAETPRLYLPQWTERILAEVQRTQSGALKWPLHLVQSWQEQVRAHFPEALVGNCEALLGVCENEENDRHVLAAAIKSGSELIVTSNLRHFGRNALEPWGISAIHPSQFLIDLYFMDAGVVVSKIESIARRRGKGPESVLVSLLPCARQFSEHVAEVLGWELK